MKRISRYWMLGVAMIFVFPAFAADSFKEMFTEGKASLFMRYRYEYVDQDGMPDEANASTLKTALGFETGRFHGLGAYLQFENTTVIGDEKYNNTINGKSEYPVVADPDGSEVNQVYASYNGIPGTMVKLGRQRIILDNARFVGNVGWRQNEQTYDAITIQNKSIPDTEFYYAYISNVNRIFGDNHPTKSDFRMKSHIIHLTYSGIKILKITAYGYLLDFDDFPDKSIKTFGIRLAGSAALNEQFKLHYSAEYADQSDYSDGLTTNDADYFRGTLGMTMNIVTFTAGYELLSGDGTYGFSTPLATLHAFNGWADKFLSTPADGLEDIFVNLKVAWNGLKFVTVYHQFGSDEGSYDYGDEWDFNLSKSFLKHYVAGIKYSTYSGDDNSQNSTALATDVDKAWVYLQLKF